MQSLKKYFAIFLKHSAPVGLFVLLPLLAALYLGHNIITLEQEKHISELSTKNENTLKDIESEIAPESFLLKVGRGAWYTLTKYENELDKFWNYYRSLCNYLHSEPDFYLFNEKGELITPREYNLKSRFLASRLWSIIRASHNKRTEYADKYKKQFKSFLGNEFRIANFLESRNSLMPIIVNTQIGYVYWVNFSNNPQKGIMIVFWEAPDFDFRLKEIINRYLDKFEDGFTRNFRGNIKSILSQDKSDYENIYLRTVLMKTNDCYLDPNGLVWKFLKLDNIWLVTALKSNSLKYDKYHTYYICFIILLGIVIIFSYIWMVKKQNSFLSIRTKLIGLFLIAVFIPVLAFSYLGYQYISDMRENLYTEFGNESRNVLLDIDRELGSSGNVFRDEFRKIVEDFKRYDEDANVRKSFEESIEKHDLVLVETRSITDGSVIKQLTNHVVFEEMSVVSEPFGKSCIDAMLKTNLSDSIDPVLRNALKSPESAMSSFWQRPDNVQDFLFGSIEFYLYWCFTNGPKNEQIYYLILRSTDRVLREHLKKRLLECRNNPKERDFQIFVCNNKNGEWFPNNSLETDLKKISNRIKFMGKPIETEIVVNSKRHLLLGLKSSKIRGYSFFALYPYEKIEEKLSKVTLSIVAAIIFFVFMALVIGYHLASTFLYPVQRLEDGVKAIKERNSQFRIETLQNDELGGLAQNFNKMIEDLKEMELAKYIQEALLPQSLPKLNGYEICFSNRMASAVGGDYFDTLLLDEDNLCIIIGDVSGHGVASALVMAIAKAVLYHGFKETRNLIELFGDVNSVVNTYFSTPPVKKMITLFATIINLPTGKAVFIDAGHNFPMKISTDSEVTEIKMFGLPIGILKKMRKQTTSEFVMEKGESVVFYTDGIVEATGNTSEQYGYDRFKKNLSEMSDYSAQSIMDTLFNRYEKWEDGTEPDDDVTLAILKRLPDEEPVDELELSTLNGLPS